MDLGITFAGFQGIMCANREQNYHEHVLLNHLKAKRKSDFFTSDGKYAGYTNVFIGNEKISLTANEKNLISTTKVEGSQYHPSMAKLVDKENK